jgi:TATA-binding protein-associated factor Taf7
MSSKQRQRHACHDELDHFVFFSYSSSQRESSDDEDESDEDENDENESDEDDEMISRESDSENQNNNDKYVDLRFSSRLVINFSTLTRCI